MTQLGAVWQSVSRRSLEVVSAGGAEDQSARHALEEHPFPVLPKKREVLQVV